MTTIVSPTPNELPWPPNRQNGSSTVALVAVAIGVHLTETGGQGDRLILRSTMDGRPDRYGVFERANAPAARWHRVTDDLTAAELDDWPARRRTGVGRVDRSFERWLERLASHPRPSAQR